MDDDTILCGVSERPLAAACIDEANCCCRDGPGLIADQPRQGIREARLVFVTELVRGGDVVVMHPDLEQANRDDAGTKQQTRGPLPQATDERLESPPPFPTNEALTESGCTVVQADTSSHE
jgi:hypothetical protein